MSVMYSDYILYGVMYLWTLGLDSMTDLETTFIQLSRRYPFLLGVKNNIIEQHW